MLYTIKITNTNGKQTTHHINATNASDAHQRAEQKATPTDTIRVYATTQEPNGDVIIDGITDGALTVVKRTTANMVNREGGNIQFRLYNECRHPNITDPDVLDMLSVARLAILDAIADGLPIDEQYHNAYLAVNRYLRGNKQINLSATAQRTMYIEDINGEIINVTGEINRIIKEGEKYAETPTNDTADSLKDKKAIVVAIARELTPVQLAVLKYMAHGYTLRQIAEKMNRSAPTIQVHINHIREKATSLFPNGYTL